jgi:hypothetical protein
MIIIHYIILNEENFKKKLLNITFIIFNYFIIVFNTIFYYMSFFYNLWSIYATLIELFCPNFVVFSPEISIPFVAWLIKVNYQSIKLIFDALLYINNKCSLSIPMLHSLIMLFISRVHPNFNVIQIVNILSNNFGRIIKRLALKHYTCSPFAPSHKIFWYHWLFLLVVNIIIINNKCLITIF